MTAEQFGWVFARHKTALHRKSMSKPIRLAVQDGLITLQSSVLDYGCGRGEDVRQLGEMGISAHGWDPVYRPTTERSSADLVNLGYVINVIESPLERVEVVRSAWNLAKRALIVSARSTLDDAPDEGAVRFGDGFATRIGSFQKFFEQSELRALIQDSIGQEALPMAPGIFAVFRDESLREAWRAQRFRRNVALPTISTRTRMFYEHKDLLEPLMAFFTERGRLPQEGEVDFEAPLLVQFGSFPKAFQVVRTVTGEEPWVEIQEARKEDLLVWLALCRFQVRPQFTALPQFLQADIKALFKAYTRACELADALLMSIGRQEIREKAIARSPFGKLTPKGLYVHINHLEELPPVLRLYEGCARAFVGGIVGANLIKFHRDGAQISYLTYQDFLNIPHPELLDSVVVSLDGRKIKRRNYEGQVNRFILHRKETFIPRNTPVWDKFHRLTLQEERWGLYEEPTTIGTRIGWETTLAEKKCRLAGHRVVRLREDSIAPTVPIDSLEVRAEFEAQS